MEQLLALRDRLQVVEDDLIATGRRNVTIDGSAGVFTWVQQGAGREASQRLSAAAEMQEVENAVVREGHDHLLVMTSHGTFTWYLAA
jgi:DNA gyrase/topoisomerase IV subunit A